MCIQEVICWHTFIHFSGKCLVCDYMYVLIVIHVCSFSSHHSLVSGTKPTGLVHCEKRTSTSCIWFRIHLEFKEWYKYFFTVDRPGYFKPTESIDFFSFMPFLNSHFLWIIALHAADYFQSEILVTNIISHSKT